MVAWRTPERSSKETRRKIRIGTYRRWHALGVVGCSHYVPSCHSQQSFRFRSRRLVLAGSRFFGGLTWSKKKQKFGFDCLWGRNFPASGFSRMGARARKLFVSGFSVWPRISGQSGGTWLSGSTERRRHRRRRRRLGLGKVLLERVVGGRRRLRLFRFRRRRRTGRTFCPVLAGCPFLLDSLECWHRAGRHRDRADVRPGTEFFFFGGIRFSGQFFELADQARFLFLLSGNPLALGWSGKSFTQLWCKGWWLRRGK